MIFRRSSKHRPSVPAPRTESTVTIEDLLQFKKHAEQPALEFWGDFDLRLKERQLAAAIQERRPAWWSALPRLALAIPASAAAALAIGFVVWRNAAPPPQPALADAPAHQPLPVATNNIAAAATPAPDTNTNAHTATPAAAPARGLPQSATIATTAAGEQPARPTAAEAAATQPVADEHLETARLAFASLATIRPHRAETTTAFFNAKQPTLKSTSTAAFFPEPAAIENEINDLIASLPVSTATSNPAINIATSAAYTAFTATAPAKPDDSADPRRVRLLTYIDNTIPVPAVAADNPRIVRLRNRVTSRFDDKSLSDSISRVATTGDTLTIKF